MELKIGQLAKRAGLTVRTLHHYDQIGLLQPSIRSTGGFRLYSRDDVIRLHRIQALKQFGCSLAEIRSFLATPETPIRTILAQQMEVLEEQARSANALRERLQRLDEQLGRGEATGLTDWLAVLEMMNLCERHLNKEELKTLLAGRTSGHLHKEWRQIHARVRDLIDRGIPPESPEAQELAARWLILLKETTGNDPTLIMKLRRIRQEGEKFALFRELPPDVVDYRARLFACARTARLSRYLTATELAEVRRRQVMHLLDWLPLVSEIRRQMELGTAVDDPVVEELAQRWEELSRDSYCGDDAALEAKIRQAFKNEPDLLVGIGIDEELAIFMERAIMNQQEVQSPSTTAPKPSAWRVATLRAAHQLLDHPLVFSDPLALPILGAEAEEVLRNNLERYETPLLRGLRVSMAIRSRLAEEEWDRARRNGVCQYVILGAGLDTYAYRQQCAADCRIFEVDLPQTQAWKHELLQRAGIGTPPALTYVAADFERVSLVEALVRSGFCREAPAFFAWLGVTMYLDQDAVCQTLATIADLHPGSGVVFDYAVAPELLSDRERKAVNALVSRTADGGEPWKTFFVPESLAAKLHSLGYSEVLDYGADELNARYLAGRDDGLHKGRVSRLLCARV